MMSVPVHLRQTLLKVAWLSVLLGLGMELLTLIVSTLFGKSLAANSNLADLVHKVSWASFVCVGVAVGNGVTSGRKPLALGVAGLISAPIAFQVAKVLHKSAASALSVDLPAGGAPSALILAVIKAVEYAVLGYVVGTLGRNPAVSFKGHALAGFVIGLVFGGLIIVLAVTQSALPIPMVALAIRAVNEIIFPIGCAIVLYTGQQIGKRLRD